MSSNSRPDATIVEENAGDAIIFVKRVSDENAPFTVDSTTRDWTSTVVRPGAKAGEDYVVASGTLTFEAGEFEKQIAIPILNDGLQEQTEFFISDWETSVKTCLSGDWLR